MNDPSTIPSSINMEVTIQRAIAFNNSGVFYHSKSQHRKSLAFFQRALQVTRIQLTELHQVRMSQGRSASYISLAPGIHVHFLFPKRDHHDDLRSAIPRAEPEDEQSTPFVFQGAIQIASFDSNKLQDQAALAPLLSGIALVSLYNIALINHVRGMEHKCRASLSACMEYYTLARDLHLHSTKAFGHAFSSSGIGCLPIMAILNNLGVLYRELVCDPIKSDFYFRDLLAAVVIHREMEALRPASHRRRSDGGTLKCRNQEEVEHTLQGFWGNLSCLLLRDLHTAKAA